MDPAEENVVPVHGLNYKDEPGQARHWLDTLGDHVVAYALAAVLAGFSFRGRRERLVPVREFAPLARVAGGTCFKYFLTATEGR